MSNNFQFLNDLISFDDKTDDLLEEKIRENEAKIQALENSNTSVKNSNLSKKSENLEKTPYFPSKGPDNIINFNSEDTFSLKEESNNSNFSNKNNIIKIESIITPLKEEREKEKINENNNSSSSTKLNNNTSNISNINSSNNKSLNLNMNISINTENKKSSDNKEQTNSKINSNKENMHFQTTEKRRNNKKKVSNFKSKNHGKDTNDNNYLYDNIDQSLYYQYVTFLSNENEKTLNKSAEKRQIHRNKISKNHNKNNSMSKDISTNDDKFSTIYQRFMDEDKKKKEKIDKMKKQKEEQDRKIYLYKPEINKKSKEITSKNKEDFYTRQKKLMEEKKKKDALLHDKYKKKEKDDKYKKRKKPVEETINKLYEWESRRKEKINKNIEKKEKEMENKIQNMATINKKSYKIKVKRNPNSTVNRLYKLDVAKRKVKQEILNQLYSPTFQPIVSQNLSQTKISTNRNSYINKKDTIEDNNTMTSIGMKNHNVSSCNFLTTNHIDNISDEEKNEKVDQLIRDRVFSKIKKKARYQSAMRFNVVKNNNDFVDDNSDNYESDNDENKDLEDNKYNDYNKNISTSYMQRTIKKINVH